MTQGKAGLLPLFPLQTVLFPGGRQPLRVFEARYMDMVTHCLRTEEVFGICLISSGSEVGQPAVPHPVGTSARIVECDTQQAGLLHVVVVGEQRFRILDTGIGPNGLLLGDVEWLEEPAPMAVPEECAMLVVLLQAIIEDLGEEHFPLPHHLDDAGWVGMRLAGVLPIPLRARQALLELGLPLDCLEIIRRYLAQQGLNQD